MHYSGLFGSIFLLVVTAATLRAADSTIVQRDVASLRYQIEGLAPFIESTRMDGRSEPISFSGEGRIKGAYHNLQQYPSVMRADRSYLQTGWEGNESMVRLAMRILVSRNVSVFSKVGFSATLPGNYTNARAAATADTGFRQVQSRDDKTEASAQIHEELLCGLTLRTPVASALVRAGGLMWIEGSPFTIWKSQPRTFAWDYLPYEWEQSVASYYDYNMARGEKAGRAAWNKKPFNGINIESIYLPGGLSCNLLFGLAERFDNYEREYADFATDLGYADLGAARGLGYGDTYRHLWYGRLAKGEIGSGLTLGFNYIGIRYDDNIAVNRNFRTVFNNPFNDPRFKDTTFCKEPNVWSLDIKGNLNDKLSMQAEIAAAMTDTVYYTYDSLAKPSAHSALSPVTPAFYASLKSLYSVPLTLNVVAAPRGFYSPFSFVVPFDAFMPYGANLLGAGRFINNSEASPYMQNMAGLSLTADPKLNGYGHLRITYGQHVQIEPSRDLIVFPYRLNGMDFFSLFQSSYNRWGNNLWDASLNNTETPWWKAPNAYQKRLGDESFRTTEYLKPFGPEAGGLRSNYLSAFEMFAAYGDSVAATANLADSSGIGDASPFVPLNRKYTFNLELDGSYDIGKLVGYGQPLFIGLYAAINGISTSFKPLAFSEQQSDMLLWSYYLRFEPAVALTDKFYLIGIAGIENWRSMRSFMAQTSTDFFATTTTAYPAAIDFRDYAFGLGFDWEMLARASLHSRIKWMAHEDINYTNNNWSTQVISGEIKLWF